jgi:hypothetical protein
MAVGNPVTSSVASGLRTFHPRWPARGFDPVTAWADYDALADELVVYLTGPAPSVVVPIDTPDRDYVFLLVDPTTEAVVGVQVEAMRVWVAAQNPRWAPLADPTASPGRRRAAVAALVADAAGLFALHGAGGTAPDAPR